MKNRAYQGRRISGGFCLDKKYRKWAVVIAVTAGALNAEVLGGS